MTKAVVIGHIDFVAFARFSQASLLGSVAKGGQSRSGESHKEVWIRTMFVVEPAAKGGVNRRMPGRVNIPVRPDSGVAVMN